MSNTQAPFGFRPSRRLDGAAPNYQLVTARIAYNNTTNQIGKGDGIKQLATGYVDLRAAGTDPLLGIFWGCEYLDPSTGYIRWFNAWTGPSGLASTTVVTAYYINDPMIIWQAQVGGTTVKKLVFADIGVNVDVLGGGAPNTAGFSVAYLDADSIGTTTTLPFRVYSDGSNIINNDPTSNYDTVEVVANYAFVKQFTGLTT